MQIIACVYESASAAFAVEIGVDAFKLHSSDLSNPQLVRLVAETGKRIDLSVGASTLTEIQTALEWIAEKSNSQVWLMYGYQNFPTPTEAVNLRYMMKLRELFELPIGYQDHTDADSEGAFWLPAAAVGLGVDILEKHITHDRTLHGVDHEAALNPAEFVRFVKMVRTIEGALGSAVPRPFSGEEVKYRKYAKKSLVAARDLSAGDLIMEQDLIPMRSDVLGLPPDQAGRLIGRALTKSVAQFYVVREQDVK
jgi:sialic acid synthase SpsE